MRACDPVVAPPWVPDDAARRVVAGGFGCSGDAIVAVPCADGAYRAIAMAPRRHDRQGARRSTAPRGAAGVVGPGATLRNRAGAGDPVRERVIPGDAPRMTAAPAPANETHKLP
jgi:hypothetical protein